MTHLTEAPILADRLIGQVANAARGGIAVFLGTVRDHHAGRGVVELEYSAYRPMAEVVIATIIDEAQARWPVAVAVEHRLGRLSIGDVAVGVAVGGGHRGECFEACRFVIEALKARVPIWKRERYTDGAEAWVDPTTPNAVHPAAAPGVSR
ncbi:MAG: molybdenum cofactor biosynthesis protein MoaE [Gemmatimonadales bacterium]